MDLILTDNWNITYLQIIVTVFIFLFGLPALIFQILSEDIRSVAWDKSWLRAGLFILLFTLLIISLLFIWAFHQSDNLNIAWGRSLLANGLVSIVLFGIFAASWYGAGKVSRKKIVSNLQKKLIRQYHKKQSLDKEKVDDLIYLGEQGMPGKEKELVLDTIANIMLQVQASEDYQGIELKRLIRGIPKILMAVGKPGSDLNFYQTSKKFKEIWNRLAQNDRLQSSDALLVTNALEQIGIAAAESKPESIVLAYLETASTIPSVLFAIGVIALQKHRFFIATAALNKLEALAEQSGDISGEKLDDLYLLGLMAHFWQLGESAQQRIKQTLARLKGICRNSLRQTILHAAQNHYSMTNYVTADKLNSLAKDITNKKPGNVRRTAAGSS